MLLWRCAGNAGPVFRRWLDSVLEPTLLAKRHTQWVSLVQVGEARPDLGLSSGSDRRQDMGAILQFERDVDGELQVLDD